MRCPSCKEPMKNEMGGEVDGSFRFKCDACGRRHSVQKWLNYLGLGWTPMGFDDPEPPESIGQ